MFNPTEWNSKEAAKPCIWFSSVAKLYPAISGCGYTNVYFSDLPGLLPDISATFDICLRHGEMKVLSSKIPQEVIDALEKREKEVINDEPKSNKNDL